jgi:pyridoxal phosphate enzyme (YggS family)
VTLVGVTKGVTADAIREAVALGLTDLGENRVQEARAKHAILRSVTPPVRWHLIGHLQRNKTRHAVELFDVIHSVDSLALIEALSKALSSRRESGGGLDILIQVNVSGEAAKFGCKPGELEALARAVQDTAHLKLVGVMTMAPFVSMLSLLDRTFDDCANFVISWQPP